MKIKRTLPLKISSAAIAIILLSFLVLSFSRVHLVYNFSPSIYCGLYLVVPENTSNLRAGDYVEFIVPEQYQPFLYGRGWLKPSMSITKQIGGLHGDLYCVNNGMFVVNGKTVGKVFTKDSLGLSLPVVNGCHTVSEGDFLPVGNHHEHSFDGRYMGDLPLNLVIGKAIPLWTM